MLDQNTDRMWYVIGAVIVGAAIIFLVNSSFPQLFASVGDTFKDKVDETSDTIGRIDSNSEGVDYGVVELSDTLRVISVGFEAQNPLTNIGSDSNIYTSSNKLIQKRSGYRGFLVYVFDDKNKLEFQQGYDVYSVQPKGSEMMSAMTDRLNSIKDSSKLIIVVGMDTSVGTGHTKLDQSLNDAMYSIGAGFDTYGNLGHRKPYILVGKYKQGQGNGYDVTGPKDIALDITVPIKNGNSSLLK